VLLEGVYTDSSGIYLGEQLVSGCFLCRKSMSTCVLRREP
jgi:hypothetical protein